MRATRKTRFFASDLLPAKKTGDRSRVARRERAVRKKNHPKTTLMAGGRGGFLQTGGKRAVREKQYTTNKQWSTPKIIFFSQIHIFTNVCEFVKM